MHLKQPKTSKTCGQHCLAMLAGVPLAEVIALLGRKSTTQPQILAAAAKLGLEQATQSWQLPSEHDTLPANAIVKTRRKGRKKFHWCCFVDGIYHDPSEAEVGRTGQNHIIVSWMEFNRTLR